MWYVLKDTAAVVAMALPFVTLGIVARMLAGAGGRSLTAPFRSHRAPMILDRDPGGVVIEGEYYEVPPPPSRGA